METQNAIQHYDCLQLSWGRFFFIAAGLIGAYDVAYLAVLLHSMLKAGVHFL